METATDWPTVEELEESAAAADGLAEARAAVLEWRALRAAIMPRGIGRSVQANGRPTFERDRIPADLYRVDGDGADLLGLKLVRVLGDRAAEMDGEAVLDYLRSAYARYNAGRAALEYARDAARSMRRPAASTSAAGAARDGRRRLAEHLARLETKWGDRLDLGGLAWEYADAYESGARLEMAGQRGTVGCTGTARPVFVFLISIPLEPRTDG